MDNGTLTHWGIKGMKWGVRRYRNKDGSLTPEGKRRYGSDSEDYQSARELRKKSVNQLSNAELKKLNERTRLEQEYSKLNPNTIQTGLKYVGLAAGTMGTVLALYNNSNQLIGIGSKFVDKVVRR